MDASFVAAAQDESGNFYESNRFDGDHGQNRILNFFEIERTQQ